MPANSNPRGIAGEYLWDGLAADGSGKQMKDDSRIVALDNFSDYNGNLSAHIQPGGSAAGRRWMGSGEMSLDDNNSFTGKCSLKITIPANVEKGRTLQQWVDTRALRGIPMNDETWTAVGNMADELAALPDKTIPVYGVRHREGGYDHLFARAAVMFGETYQNSVHTGMGFSGGYFNRPNPTIGAPGGLHPGSSAGYRSNGFDRFIASLETNMRHQHPMGPPPAPRQPGWLNIYNYGAEQTGIHGNHVFADGTVVPATGGDGTRFLSRVETDTVLSDGTELMKSKGFVKFNNYCPPLGEWLTLEYELKLNTVDGTPIPPGPNHNYRQTPGNHPEFVNAAPIGSKEGRGPQPIPGGSPDYKVHADGIIRVWLNGELIMNYEDVIIRHTNEMVIDLVAFSAYFRNAPQDISVWYDNVVVATEYIGQVNKTGPDPDK